MIYLAFLFYYVENLIRVLQQATPKDCYPIVLCFIQSIISRLYSIILCKKIVFSITISIFIKNCFTCPIKWQKTKNLIYLPSSFLKFLLTFHVVHFDMYQYMKYSITNLNFLLANICLI